MKRKVTASDFVIYYDLVFKRIKNLNLRVKGGEVFVLAPYYANPEKIDEFVKSKSGLIYKAIKNSKNKPEKIITPPSDEQKNEFVKTANEICERVYSEFYAKYKIGFPTIKFRYMTARWGSCNIKKQVITLNYALFCVEKRETEYVIYHEFTHLLVFNHSAKFYKTLEKFCPDYKISKNALKEFIIKR